MNGKPVFGHVELSHQDVPGQPRFAFRSIVGQPFPLLTVQPLQANGDCHMVAIAQDMKAHDVYHVVSCKRSNGMSEFAFMPVQDVLDMRNQLNACGVPNAVIDAWNLQHYTTPVTADSAKHVLRRAMKRQGCQLKVEL